MDKLTDIEKELLAALKALVEVMPQTYVHFPDQREAVRNAWALIEKIKQIQNETPATTTRQNQTPF